MNEIGAIDQEPMSYTDTGLTQRHSYSLPINKDGVLIRMWVKAHDKMEHVSKDNFVVGFDGTVPFLRNVTIQPNVRGRHTYNSR